MTIKKRTSTMNREAAAKATAVIKSAQRSIHAKSAPTARSKSLYFFQTTPKADLLRAYMLAMILAQCGKVCAGAPFKLWPGANFLTHIKARRMKRAGKDTYVLTAEGVNHFTVEGKQPDKEVMGAMLDAVKSGKRPSIWNKQLSAIEQ